VFLFLQYQNKMKQCLPWYFFIHWKVFLWIISGNIYAIINVKSTLFPQLECGVLIYAIFFRWAWVDDHRKNSVFPVVSLLLHRLKNILWKTLLWWNMMKLYLFPLKTDCSNKISIFKIYENGPFQVSYSTHDDRNNYQVTFTFIENPGNSLKNTVMMKLDDLTFILIENDCTNKFIQIKWKQSISFLIAQIIIEITIK